MLFRVSPSDDVERQLHIKKQQSTDNDSVEIEAASFKKFPVEVNCQTWVVYTVL